MSKPLTDVMALVRKYGDARAAKALHNGDAQQVSCDVSLSAVQDEMDALRTSLAAAEDKNATLIRDLELACRDLAAVKLSRDAAEAKLADEVRHADALRSAGDGMSRALEMFHAEFPQFLYGMCALSDWKNAHAARRAGKEETK